ncbi:MAG: F0F1 ATP synthase subunit B [Candidatus Nanopelagicales bacterium]|jgi:F-type H+-transporting ATPase subunit b|nr:F0F1 ATP synthase subunit B [Candidatus Nanopelagicales bacterium]
MTTVFIVAAEEPNPLLPASYDILWGSISFFILLALFWKFVLPRFNEMVEERAERIEGGIERAKVMQAEAARTRDAYSAQLEAANKEAAAIRTSAQAEGEQIIAAARAEAAAQAAAVTARADAQIQAERAAAVGSLQRDVGDLAVQLASRIVGETLTDDQRARATVDRFIAELEASTSAQGSGTP